MHAQNRPIILAVDDDTIILNTVISALQPEYSVRPFTSGEAALAYLERQTADLILLDQNMPKMSGLEVLQRLHSHHEHKNIPIVFLTASAQGENEVEALKMGAVDYIQKPFRPQALLTRVRLQIELQSHRRYLEALVAEKTKHLHDAYGVLKSREDAILMLLARVTDLRDHETGDHLERTTEFVRIMVEDLMAVPKEGYTLTQREAQDIVESAKLHDLGKIAMPDHILLKPGRLTPEEFEIIKTHAERGATLLTDAIRQMRETSGHNDDAFLSMGRDIARSHHEKWDGTGYPDGAKGVEIPLAGRIAAIADVYDAVSSVRPYKHAFSAEESARIIQDGSGTHFDPYLVTIFTKHAATFGLVGKNSNTGNSP